MKFILYSKKCEKDINLDNRTSNQINVTIYLVHEVQCGDNPN